MKKIAVVVTTFNSSKYIGRLIEKLLSQSYPIDRIIVADNNSSDNTCDIIQNFQNNKIHLHQLNANLGGAGGFAKCFEIAQNSGCDYIISFDDDAYPPSTDFIADMVAIKEQYDYDVVSALVVDSDNHKLSAYEYKINGDKYTHIDDIQKYERLDGDIKPFNGVLFDKKAIKKIGIPRADFFIRGDEQEYKTRILNAGFKTTVFTKAIVYHPTSLNEYFYINQKRYHYPPSSIKLFYSTRNQVHILASSTDISLRKKRKMIYRFFKQYTWFYLVYKKDFKRYRVWLRAFLFGLLGYMKNDFQG